VTAARPALSPRQEQVLLLLGDGMGLGEIAARLGISEALTGTHVGNILGKLHVASRTGSALYARREEPESGEGQG